MSQYFPDPSECGHHTIFGNVPIRTYAGEHMQMSLVDVPPNGVVDWHSHANEQMGLVVRGTLVFFIGDEEKTLHEGEMYCIPGGIRHKVVALDEPAQALDIFYPIRDEYR